MPSVLLLLYPGFSEFAVTVALAVLRARYRLVTIAPEAGPLTSEAGLRVVPAQGFAFVPFGLRIEARLGALRDAAAVRAYYRGQGDLRWEG